MAREELVDTKRRTAKNGVRLLWETVRPINGITNCTLIGLIANC